VIFNTGGGFRYVGTGEVVPVPTGMRVASIMGLVVVGTTVVCTADPVFRGVVFPHVVVFRVGTLCPHPEERIRRMRTMVIAPAQRMELISEYLINHIFMPLSRETFSVDRIGRILQQNN
jgi:hypothetical protein